MDNKFPNKVIKITDFDIDTQAKIRDQKDGLMTNMLIVDKEKDILHGYTQEGKYYYTNIEFTYAISEYRWYVDSDYIVTDDAMPCGTIELGTLVSAYIQATN